MNGEIDAVYIYDEHKSEPQFLHCDIVLTFYLVNPSLNMSTERARPPPPPSCPSTSLMLPRALHCYICLAPRRR